MPGGRFSVEAIFKAVDRMTRPIAKMESSLGRMTRRAAGASAQLDRAFGMVHRGFMRTSMGVAAGAAAAGAGFAALIRPALAVEEQMAKVATVTTPSMKSMSGALAETRAAAIDWSKKHVATAEEFLEATYNMASAGLNHAQALAGTRAALSLATATMGDAETAGNMLATVYNNLGDKSADVNVEMTRLADVLAKTQALFQIKDLSQLNESLKLGAPAAIQYGVSIEQLSTVLGALNTAGLQGSMAGTAFSASMRQMTKASKSLGFEISKTATGGVDFVGTLKNIAAKFGDFSKMSDAQKSAFQKAFGDEGIRAISLMLGKTDELDKSLRQVTESTGAAAAQEATIEGARMNRLRIMGNRIRAVAIEAGGALLPVLDDIAPHIEGIVASMGKWVTANRGLITSEVLGFVKGVRDNLPAIVTWMKRIGQGVVAFYALAAAVKVVRVGIAAAQITMKLYELATRSTTAATIANGAAARSAASANAAYAAATNGWVGQTAAAGKGLTGLRAALNASALGTQINGVTGLLGKAGLLGAALAVGVAIGSWLNATFGLDEKISGWIAKLTGIEDELNKGGGRRKHRGIQPHDERVHADGSITDASGRPVRLPDDAPQVTSAQDRAATRITESFTNTERAELTIRDETKRAVLERKGRPNVGPRIRLQPSGAR